jgi:histidyl-tRNA synthetase
LVINSVGDETCRPEYVRALRDYLKDNAVELCDDCLRRIDENPLRVLDCKKKECIAVVEEAPSLREYLCRECTQHLHEVEELLTVTGLDFSKEERLVRGLDYYSRTVFEFLEPSLGAQNALAAGGRYDHLIEDFGGKPTPAVGFSIGLERVMLAKPQLESGAVKGVYVMAISDEARRKAFDTASRLRDTGIRADLDHLMRSPKAQMREADRSGFPLCLIIGEDELSGGYYSLKDMNSGAQQRVDEADILEELMRRLSGGLEESPSDSR